MKTFFFRVNVVSVLVKIYLEETVLRHNSLLLFRSVTVSKLFF